MNVGDDIYTDAVVAINIDSGEIVWGNSLIGYEGWNVACTVAFFFDVDGCPDPEGYFSSPFFSCSFFHFMITLNLNRGDYDIGAGAVLIGDDQLVVGQKSGIFISSFHSLNHENHLYILFNDRKDILSLPR